MEEELALLKERVKILEGVLNFIRSDNFIFSKNIQMQDGRNIIIATGTGTKIGTSVSSKISVFGVTPVIQAGGISAPPSPSGSYVQSEAQAAVTAINAIRAALSNFGITAGV